VELGWKDMTMAAADNRQQIEQAGNHNSVKNHGRENPAFSSKQMREVMHSLHDYHRRGEPMMAT